MSGVAAGAAGFAVVMAVWSMIVTVRGASTSSLTWGLVALEMAVAALVGTHVVALGGAPTPKQAGYFAAGVCLLPMVMLGAGDDPRGRPLVAAFVSAAVAVLVLRIETVT